MRSGSGWLQTLSLDPIPASDVGKPARSVRNVTAADDDCRRVRYHDVAAAVGVVDNRDLLRHRSGPPGGEAWQGRRTPSTHTSPIVQLGDPEYTVLVKLDKECARPPERFDAYAQCSRLC
jgi:hypothetical protein